MMKSTSRFLVPFALGAIGLLSLALVGCSKSEEGAKSVSPSSYVKDGAFQKKLAAQNAERTELAGIRADLVEKMKAKVDAVRSRLGAAADEKAVLAELEKDSEWKSLYSRCADANTALDEQRRRTLAIVRERIAPKKTISK